MSKPWNTPDNVPFNKREMTSFDSIISARMSCTNTAAVARAREMANVRLRGLFQVGASFTAKQRQDLWLWAILSMTRLSPDKDCERLLGDRS